MEYGGLPVLVPLLRSGDTETVTAAVAALRNLSIHKGNEVGSAFEGWDSLKSGYPTNQDTLACTCSYTLYYMYCTKLMQAYLTPILILRVI